MMIEPIYIIVFLLDLPIFYGLMRLFFKDVLDCLLVFRLLGQSRYFPEIYEELWDDMIRLGKFAVWVFLCSLIILLEFMAIKSMQLG